MKITLYSLLAKHAACVAALDDSKSCETCAHKDLAADVEPCKGCYNELIGMPVNPTNWVSQ